jgi:hypothetical protein
MRKLLALAAVPAVFVLSGVTASASGVTVPDGVPHLLFRASEDSGRIAVDSSSFHNDGYLRGGIARVDGTYRFHTGVPRDRIRVHHDPSLNPEGQPFAFGADVRVSPHAVWANKEMAVIRHGDKDTPGGDYKLEFEQTERDSVVATCVMHDGSGGSGFVKGNGRLATLDDGQWHRVTCSREPAAETVSLTIDGFTVARPANELDSIVGADPLLIGVQPRTDGTGLREQFVGRIDNIKVSVGAVAVPECPGVC